MFSATTIALLGWGALAFGSEYAWAYAPLLVFSLVVSLLGLLASRGGRLPARAPTFAIGAIVVGGLLQLVPLPHRAVTAISPASVVGDYGQLYAKATMQPISIIQPASQPRNPPASCFAHW